MPKIFRFFCLFALIHILISCDSNPDLIYPPKEVVNRVTDFYVFNDGKTFLYLNSNTNRQYDFGEIVLMEIDDEGDLVFKDSLLVPSIAGKMKVSSDEKSLFVTTRDKHGVVKAKITGKSGSYRLQYESGVKGDYPDILKTKKEPYAVALNEDESKLLVTHVLNGELSIVDIREWKVLKTLKLKYGVTEIVYDEISGYFLASHRSSGNITLIEARDTLNDFVVEARELPIDLPTHGYDVRSMKQSGDGSVFYAAFQNSYSESSYDYNYDEDTAPQIVTFKLEDKELKIVKTVSVSGNLGELAVLPYSSEASDSNGSDGENSGDTEAAAESEEESDGDDGGASDGTEENKKAQRVGDMIFVSVTNEEKVLIIDSARNSIRDEISYKDDKKECKPYQLYAKSTGNTTGYLFVSCFQNDRVHVYGIDLMSEQIIRKIGVLE